MSISGSGALWAAGMSDRQGMLQEMILSRLWWWGGGPGGLAAWTRGAICGVLQLPRLLLQPPMT